MNRVSGKGALQLAALALAGLSVVMIGYRAVVSPQPLVGLATVIAWLALFALACLGVGRPVLGWLVPGTGWSRLEELLLGTTAGAGVLILMAFFLGTVGWLFAPLLGAVVLAAAAAGAVQLWRRAPGPPRGSQVPRVAAALLVAAAAVTLLAVPTPSAFYDELHYHLAFPFQWLRLHRMVPFMREDYAFLPANMGMLYLYALALLSPGAAQALHWGMGALAVTGVACLARVLRGEVAGWWGAVIYATTPAVLLTATWAASDLGSAAFAAAAWVMAVRAYADAGVPAGPRYWAFCGAFAGLAVGCKEVALATVVAPLGLALLAVRGPGSQRSDRRLARATWFAVGVTLAFLPWMVRNLVLVGNPVYPLLSAAGVGGTRAIERAAMGRLALTVPTMLAWLASKARVVLLGTFAPRGAAGDVGLVYLGLLPVGIWPLVRRWDRLARLLVVGFAGSLLAWGLVPQLGRYLLPALVLLAAVEGAAWDELLSSWRGPVGRWLTGLLAVGLTWGMLGARSVEVVDRMVCTVGVMSQDDWLKHSVDYWSAASFVNEHLPATAKVLLVGEARCMYIDRNVVVEDPYQTPLLSELAERERSASAIARRLRQRGITDLLVNWSETARIAEMTGRKDFFALPTPAAQDRLRAFFRDDIRPIFTDGRVQVFALTGGAR